MRFVIVGSGAAGINAARSISAANIPDSTLDIYTQETYPYYPRPRLPDFLAGDISLNDLIIYSEDWYDRRNIRLHLGAVATRIDPVAKRLMLNDGASVEYDRLLLANGSHPNIPPFAGTDKEGVFALRTLADALAIREYANTVEQAIIIGGGLLGLEAARGLSVIGPRITVVEFFSRLLPRQLDEQAAAVLQKQIEEMGISVVTDAVTEAIVGGKRAAGIRLKSGREIAAEQVLISAGIRSNIELVQDAGIQVNRGVIVNAHMQTSAPDIWAAGDVAEFEGRTWGIVSAAIEQARVAAANMIASASDSPATYTDIVPSNTLKVMGIDLTSIGLVNPESTDFSEYRRADESAGTYQKLVIRNGIIMGAILLGNRHRVRPVMELITKRIDVSSHMDNLLEEDFDLSSLVSA